MMLHFIGVMLVWGMIWAVTCLLATMWERVNQRDIKREVERQLLDRS